MSLIQLPDNPNSNLEGIQALATGSADYSMNQFVMIEDAKSGRVYFGQITGPQRNLNRTGLNEYDQSTITSLEAVAKNEYGRDAVVHEAFLYSVRLLREVTGGSVEVVTRRPQIASIGRAAEEEEVIQFLNLPDADDKTIIGTVPGTEVGIYYDHKRLVYHSLLAGATGSGKSNAGANIIKAAVNSGFGVICYDHKPDYQNMHEANAEGDADNQQKMSVQYWYLGSHKDANGHSIKVPASAFSPGILAATIFWCDNETQQREEMEHGLEIFSDERTAAGVEHWTLNDFYWWFTKGAGSKAKPEDVENQVGHKINDRTLRAFLNKITRRNRRPTWVDGVDVGSPLAPAAPTGSVMGRTGGKKAPTNWFNPVGVVELGGVLCIKVNGSDAGREYGLFLDFMMKRIERARANRDIKHPVMHFIDEAQDIFSGSKRFAEAAGRSMSTMIRKGRSLNIAFTIAVQSADQVPEDIRNNLNSHIIMRHNNASAARAALEKATDTQLAQTAYFGPGQALVDLFGSNAVVQAQMLRAPFALTVDNFEADIDPDLLEG
jgi:hypothetical protein